MPDAGYRAVRSSATSQEQEEGPAKGAGLPERQLYRYEYRYCSTVRQYVSHAYDCTASKHSQLYIAMHAVMSCQCQHQSSQIRAGFEGKKTRNVKW
jgi:hypothetical protein